MKTRVFALFRLFTECIHSVGSVLSLVRVLVVGLNSALEYWQCVYLFHSVVIVFSEFSQSVCRVLADCSQSVGRVLSVC